MRQEIIIKKYKDTVVSALIQDDEYKEFEVHTIGLESLIGNIYLGKIKNIVPNIRGAFVEIAGKQLCYYPMNETDLNQNLHIEDEILIQIKKEGSKEKLPLATQNIELTGEHLVLTAGKSFVGISNRIENDDKKKRLRDLLKPYVTDSYGFIVRTSAVNVEPKALFEEALHLQKRYETLQRKAKHLKPFQFVGTNRSLVSTYTFGLFPSQVSKVITDEAEFKEMFLEKGYSVLFYNKEDGSLDRRYRLKHYLEEALKEKIWLKSGAFLVIEQTEAMAVIDVNSGKSIGKGKKEKHIVKINKEAAVEIARQIRLRNLSGIIVVDFIDMKRKEDQQELIRLMKTCLENDPRKSEVVDITKLGLMEITRKKEKKSISETKLKYILTERE